jgi:hypothetical protein
LRTCLLKAATTTAVSLLGTRGNNTERMQLSGLSKARPISCSDCPAFQRLQTSHFSIAETQTVSLASCQHHLSRADLHQMVLHRPIECTPFTGHLEDYFRVADNTETGQRVTFRRDDLPSRYWLPKRV